MFLATLNVVGGFVVTDRMLEMFNSKPGERAKASAASAEAAAKSADADGSAGPGGAA